MIKPDAYRRAYFIKYFDIKYRFDNASYKTPLQLHITELVYGDFDNVFSLIWQFFPQPFTFFYIEKVYKCSDIIVYYLSHPSRTQKKFDGNSPGNRAYSKYRWDMYFTDIVVVKISLSLLAFYRT